MSSTRDLAREAAFEMLMAGTKPSVESIREQLELGRGSDNTILEGLDEFWSELGQLIQDWQTFPKIPDDLAKAMNEWWYLAMKEANLSSEDELKEMKNLISDAQSGLDAALLEKEQSSKHLESISLAKYELNNQLEKLNENYQIQQHDFARLDSENSALKKEQLKLIEQINTQDKNHKEALNLSYERAQETEREFAKQIDALKIQADKTQVTLTVKEKEWKTVNQKNLKKIDELHKQLKDSEDFNQKSFHEINQLVLAVDENKKIIHDQNQQKKQIESDFSDLIVGKDQKIQGLVNEVSNLKDQIITYETKKNALEKSQNKLENKFNQLLEIINSQE
ncbi:MAG: DNA-binding protein [Gammaproteobacteria bacterium]|nr:DNA-binding protein [Gammaproteobacteria bacterium]